MAPEKLLAEWFWTDRWIGSSAFLLPLEPRGLYREMLTQAWRRGGRLPNDHEAIRRAVGCTVAEWKRCWPKIEPYWRVEGEHLINDTQAEVIEGCIAAHQRAVERGRKGGKARALSQAQVQEQLEEQLEAQAQEQLVLKHKPPDPSPSSPPKTVETRARGAGAGGGVVGADAPVRHGDCVAHGPICLKPRVALELAPLFKGQSELQTWACAVGERWNLALERGERLYTADGFEFWRTEYKRDFGSKPVLVKADGRTVEDADETSRYLANLRAGR